MNKKKKAFTLIELIITLSLTTIILGVIYTFFITNTKSLSKIEINSDLQTEVQNIQKELLNYLTQSEGIEEVTIGRENLIIGNEETLYKDFSEYEGKVDIKNIKFKGQSNDYEVTFDESGKLILRALDKNKKSIDGLPKVLSNNVTEFKIRPLDYRTNYENGTLKKASGIEIILILSKKKGYSEVETPSSLIVKFRNKQYFREGEIDEK